MENVNVILEAFDSSGWVRYNKTIAKKCGIEAAVMLGELLDKFVYWGKKDESGKSNFYKTTKHQFTGEFFCTRENIEEETGLTSHHQRKGIEALGTVVKIIYRDLPRKAYYSLDFAELDKLLSSEDSLHQASTDLTANDEAAERQLGHRNDGTNNKLTKNKEKEHTTKSNSRARPERNTNTLPKETESVSALCDAWAKYNVGADIRDSDIRNLNRLSEDNVTKLTEALPYVKLYDDKQWTSSSKHISVLIQKIEQIANLKNIVLDDKYFNKVLKISNMTGLQFVQFADSYENITEAKKALIGRVL